MAAVGELKISVTLDMDEAVTALLAIRGATAHLSRDQQSLEDILQVVHNAAEKALESVKTKVSDA